MVTSCLKSAALTDLVKGLAGVDSVPAAGLCDQSGQQGATGEVDRGFGAPGEAVGRVGKREPVQDGGSDVCQGEDLNKPKDFEIVDFTHELNDQKQNCH